MIAVDERLVRAPAHICFHVAADVERWPEILPHYRYVRFRERRGPASGVVEMAAWRHFGGPVRYPTWWVSEMRGEPDQPAVRYRHIEGITRGMDVIWEFHPEAENVTRVRIVHTWAGPRWPLIGGIAADLVIGPHFISAIAQRTLAGVGQEAERRARAGEERGGGGRDRPPHGAGLVVAPGHGQETGPADQAVPDVAGTGTSSAPDVAGAGGGGRP